MTDPNGTPVDSNPFDKYDLPDPVAAPPKPEAQPDEQATEASQARETVGGTGQYAARRRALPPPEAPKEPEEGANPFDKYDKAPNEDGVGLMERYRLNQMDSFYRHSVMGSLNLAALAHVYETPDPPDLPRERKEANKAARDQYVKAVSDLAAYDQMTPYGNTLEALTATAGAVAGGLVSPESWIGWGAKGASWGYRALKAGAQQAGVQAVADPIAQRLAMAGGGQQEFDWARMFMAPVTGFAVGAGGHLVGEAAGHALPAAANAIVRASDALRGPAWYRQTLYHLGQMDESFADARHSIWALDPNNGIEARPVSRETSTYGIEPPAGEPRAELPPVASTEPAPAGEAAAPPPPTTMPPPAPGTVRMYHGGADANAGGERHVTPDPEYARNYRNEKGDNPLWYVDVPADSPWLKEVDVSGTNMPRSFMNSVAPADVMANARRMPEHGETAAPPPTEGETTTLPPVTEQQKQTAQQGLEAHEALQREAARTGLPNTEPPADWTPAPEELKQAERVARGWKPEKPLEPPQSLTAFVRKNGGLNIETMKGELGDHAKMPFLLQKRGPKTGRGPDDMAELARDSGYDIGPDTGIGNGVDTDRFMEMLHEDLGGRQRHYPGGADAEAFQRQNEFFEQFSQHLDDLGLKPKGMDPRQIAWILRQDPDAGRFLTLINRIDELGEQASVELAYRLDAERVAGERDVARKPGTLRAADHRETEPVTLEEMERHHAEYQAATGEGGQRQPAAGENRSPEGGTLAPRETETAGPGRDNAPTEVSPTGRGGPAEGGAERPAGEPAGGGTGTGAEGEAGNRAGGPAGAEGEAGRVAPRPAALPKEVPDAVFRGEGRVDMGAAYNQAGAAYPIAGPGQYFSFNQEHAQTFGPTLIKANVGDITRKPLVITSDGEWQALTKAAGWEFPNPFGKSAEEMKGLTEALQRVIKEKGHDGIVVWWDRNTKTDESGGKRIKTLRNVFDEPQVIGFGEPKAAPKAERTAQGEQILLEGVEPVTDKERAEAKGRRPMQGGNKPMDEGIFDVGGRGQTELPKALPPERPPNVEAWSDRDKPVGYNADGNAVYQNYDTRQRVVVTPDGKRIFEQSDAQYGFKKPYESRKPEFRTVDEKPMATDADALEDKAGIAQRRGGGGLPEEQRRPAAGTPQPPPSPDPTPSPQQETAIQSLQRQVTALAAAFDTPVRQGRVTIKNAVGIYKHTGVVRVKELPDFEAVVHELGHRLEAIAGPDLTHLTDLHAIELAPIVSNAAAYNPNQYVTEGFAEFIRRYVGNPERAMNIAPAFYDAWQAFMTERHPDLLKALNDAHAAYAAYNEAPSVDSVRAVRRSKVETEGAIGKALIWAGLKKKGQPPTFNSVVQAAYETWYDNKAPMARAVRELGAYIQERLGGDLVNLRPGDNPEILVRQWERARQGAVRDAMDGVRPYHDIRPSGPSITDAITYAVGAPSMWGKWNEAKVADFDTYLIAKRGAYLWDRYRRGLMDNPPTAFNHGDAQQAMADLARDNPNFEAAAWQVHNYTRNVLLKAYEGGILSADAYRGAMAHEFYVPFNRDRTDLEGGMGRSMGGSAEGPGMTEIVKGIRGSSRDIISPLESIMMQSMQVNRTLAHNDIILALRNLARRAGKEGGRYFEELAPKEAAKYTVDLEDLLTKRAKEIGMDPDDAKLMIAALGDPTAADPMMASYFKMEQTKARGEPLVFYREGGELKVGRMMSAREGHGLYELMTATPEPVTDLWVQLIGASAGIKRAGIITNPTFALTNYIRDQVAASILRSDYVPIASGLRGLAEEFAQGNNAVLYGYAGGVAGGASVGPVDRAIEADLNALAKKGYAVNRLTSFHGLMELASFTEAGTRNSVFAKVFEQSKAKGLNDWDAMVEAAFQAQDLLDFSRHGSRTRVIARLLPFLNAHMQGLDKARRTLEPMFRSEVFKTDVAARRNAWNTAFKFGAAGSALGAAWAAVNADNEAYRDSSPYFKGTHFIVPWGNKVIVVPKPFELGLGFTAGEYAFHALAQKDPRAASQFVEAAWQALAPPNPISDIPVISTVAELTLGRTAAVGPARDIVPERLQRLPSTMQFDDRTSELAKWLGKQTGLSPIKIEYGIGSFFGTWGRDVMALSQGVSENSPAASLDDSMFTRRFIKDPTRSSQTTIAFWNYMSSKTGTYNQDVAAYNDMVHDSITRGQPLTPATDFLSKLPTAEKAFVTLKSAAKENGKPAFTADERRLHPLQRAYDAVQMLNGLRRELSSNTTTSYADKAMLKLNPEQRRDLLQNVRMLSQMEMRNAFVMLGDPGYVGRPMYDVHEVMGLIRHTSPAVADEIATRYATNKIYTTDAVRAAWPKLSQELVRHGSTADIGTLAGDAKMAGFEFSGTKARKPGVLRAPIAGSPTVH